VCAREVVEKAGLQARSFVWIEGLDAGDHHAAREWYAEDRSANPPTIGDERRGTRGDELRALRRLQREQDPKSAYVFTSERGAPFSTAGFLRMVQRAGEVAALGFPTHPHMLRHATGFRLANDGVDTRTLQAYLGHKSIGNTVRYTELSPTRFKDLWR